MNDDCTCRVEDGEVVNQCYAASHPFTGRLHVQGVRTLHNLTAARAAIPDDDTVAE